MSGAHNNTLYLGLTLAGAVSAGAYTAGVMDFLIEALDAWERHRGEKHCPTHKVVIPVIGGASAGGMTGIIASTIVDNPLQPVRRANSDHLEERPENKLYHSWVDMLEEDMFSRMLEPSDIEDEVHSILNSGFIDELADRALAVDPDRRIDRPYFDEPLKVFTTLTDLNGLRFHSYLESGEEEEAAHYFYRHSNYAAFKLNDSEYAGDGWIPLDYCTGKNVGIARQAAMATGAFPVGLQARHLVRNRKYVKQLDWNRKITANWPVDSGMHRSLCVDGGVINNEPFYKVKDVVEQLTEDHSETKGDDSLKNWTTLMIDPFPSEKKDTLDPERDDLVSVAKSTLSAMLSQGRLKEEALYELDVAYNPSRYLIAPVRYEGEDEHERSISGSRALACGFLGGFGGFLHKEFRIHDYFLGRANCERFLREYFTFRPGTKHPIIEQGYEHIPEDQFVSSQGQRQIIPVFDELITEGDDPYIPKFKHAPRWPVRREEEIDRFLKPMKKRIGKIIMNLADLNGLSHTLLWIGNRVLLRRKLAKAAMDEIKSQMKDWDLLMDD